MDGVSATRELRKRGVSTPIVAFSASTVPEEIQGCLNAGCIEHLSKPFYEQQLVRTLGHALGLGTSKWHKRDETAAQAHAKSDAATLDTECLVGRELYEALIDEWLVSVTSELDDLKAAMAENNCTTVRNITHKIRGTASLLGLLDLSELAKRIEYAADQENVTEIHSGSKELLDGFAELSASRDQR